MTTQYYTQPRPEMLPFVPDSARRVLEVGCGEGLFSASLHGVEERWGIEPSAAADRAEARLTRVLRGTFDAVRGELPEAYFDLVVCNDVIEHMPDHEGFLRSIQHHMAPGGMLIGSIPNIRYYGALCELLFEGDWHYRDAGIFDRTHLAFFTGKSLRATLQRCGFEVRRLEGINRTWRGTTRRDRIYLAMARILSVLSLGHMSDTLYLQFGFQAVPAAKSPHIFSADSE